MGLAVVTVASGGLPVVDVTATTPKLGLPVTETTRGVAVTKVTAPKPGLAVVYGTFVDWPPAGGGAGAPILTTFATLNGTPSAGVVMSNGNLTATHGTTGNGVGVASTMFLGSGKFYFEDKLLVAPSVLSQTAGIILSTGTFFEMAGGGPNNTSVICGGGNSAIFSNNVNTGKLLGATVVGDVFGFAIDMTARLGWIRRNNGNWNGDAAANPATGTGGVTISAGNFAPAVSFSNTSATDAWTVNFGQAAFAFTAPSGFSLGWGT
jgi:hypothetical protein